MRLRTITILIALSLGLSSGSAVWTEEQPAVTRLELRDRIVDITVGYDGLRYSVLGKDGKVIDANLNESQLQAKHPDIHQKIRPALAQPLTPGTVNPLSPAVPYLLTR